MVTLCYTKKQRQLWERLPNLGDAVAFMMANKIDDKHEPFVFDNGAESSIILYEDLIDAVQRGVIKPTKTRVEAL